MAGIKLYSLESNDPRLLGPYRLLRRIATGGMGRIYGGGDAGIGWHRRDISRNVSGAKDSITLSW